MAPTSAAMLMVLATTSRPISAVVSQRGHILAMLVARPSPVTQPMRADSIWMPIISGRVRNKRPDEGEAELRARLRIGGDAARVVVGGAGDEARAEAGGEALARRLGGHGGRCGAGDPAPAPDHNPPVLLPSCGGPPAQAATNFSATPLLQ